MKKAMEDVLDKCLFRKLLLPLAVVGLAVWGSSALAQGKETVPTAAEIIQQAVVQSKKQEDVSKKYTFLQRIKKEELDDDGNVEETEKLVIRSVPVGDTQYNRLEKKNGAPLAGDDLVEEQEKEREFLDELKKNNGKKQNKEEGSFEFNEKFVAKYNFTLRGEQTINNRPAYLFEYKPKSGDLPEENMADRFMNKTEGTLWIDKEDLVISKAKTHLVEPIKVFGGIAASIQKMDFTLTFEKRAGKWFPHSIKQRAVGRQLVSSFNTRVSVEFDSFEKKDK